MEVAEKVLNGISYALNVCKKVDFPNPISPIHTRSPIYTVSLNIVCTLNSPKLVLSGEITKFESSAHFFGVPCLNLPELMSDFLHSFQFRQFLHLTYFSAKIKVKLILDMTHNSRKLFIETYIRDYVLEEEIIKISGF